MGRLALALVAGAIVSAGATLPASGQSPSPAPVASATPPVNGTPTRPMRERWRNMSPEERRRFRANIDRWLALPPDERRVLRFRDDRRRQQLREEVENAMRASGLQLEGERRQQYVRRYLQERREIERALRQEMRERREKAMAPVIERLKQEFGQPAAPVASPTPAK